MERNYRHHYTIENWYNSTKEQFIFNVVQHNIRKYNCTTIPEGDTTLYDTLAISVYLMIYIDIMHLAQHRFGLDRIRANERDEVEVPDVATIADERGNVDIYRTAIERHASIVEFDDALSRVLENITANPTNYRSNTYVHLNHLQLQSSIHSY